MNDAQSQGASIFTNAFDLQPGSGDTGTYTPGGGSAVDLTNVTVAALDQDPHALDGYDTVILYQTCDIGTAENKPALDEINAFLAAGHKAMIFDADGCSSSSSGARGATPDWSGFILPFQTDNPGPKGAAGDYAEVESSPLTAGLATGAVEGDAVGDANIFTTYDARWAAAIRATNTDGVSGILEAYARTPAGGLALYEGEDFWYTQGKSAHLQLVFDDMLAKQWNPDDLPSSTNATGVAGCSRNAVKIGVVTVCADHISGVGSGSRAVGNVILDGGVGVGDGPIDLSPDTHGISSAGPASLALLRPGGPVALGTASFSLDATGVTDPTSGVTGLAKATLGSVSLGPLASLRVGGLPLALQTGAGLSVYLDSQNGGGLIGSGTISLPLAGKLDTSAALSLGFYADTTSAVVVLGGMATFGKFDFGGGWSFDGLSLSYQQVNDAWSVSGGFTAPIGSLKASGDIRAGRLDAISVDVGGQAVPLADSGFFFSDFGGSAQGISSGPLRITASTGGFWGAPGLQVEPFYLDGASVTVDFGGSLSIDGAVSFAVKKKSPVHGQLHLKVGLRPFMALGKASVEASLPGAVSLNVDAAIGFTTSHFTLAGRGTLDLHGLKGTGNGVVSDKGAGASGDLCTPKIPLFGRSCYSLGFAGTWQQIGHLDLPSIIGGDPQQLVTVPGVAAVGRGVAVRVAPGRSLLFLDVQGGKAPPRVRLVAPDGKTYDSARPGGVLLVETQPQFNLTAITIVKPRPGVWRISSVEAGSPAATVHAQTIHQVRLLRTQAITPLSSARHPLGAAARPVLRWSSKGLPATARVSILRSSQAQPTLQTTALASGLRSSGSYPVPVRQLVAGRNVFTLIASVNGVPFQEVGFAGAAWRKSAKPVKKPHR